MRIISAISARRNLRDWLSGINTGIGRLGFIQKFYNYAVFSVASIFFGYVTVRIFFPLLDSRTTPLRGIAAVFAFFAAFMALWAFDRFLARKMGKTAAIAAVIFLVAANAALQALCLYYLEVKPSWDFGAIMGASEDISAGRPIRSWKYFQEYPYNLYPAVYIGIFRMLLGGCRSAPYILNIISVTASIIGACFLAYKLYGHRASVLAALLCLAVTPLYLYIPIVYTDTLSMPFPIWTACVRTYLHAGKMYSGNINGGNMDSGKKNASRNASKKKIIICCVYCALIGLLSAFGFLVKQVAAVGIAAFAVDYFFNRKEYNSVFTDAKNILSKVIQGVLPLGVALFTFAAALYSAEFCLERNGFGSMLHSDRRLPHAHWLMMGMNQSIADGGTSSGYGGFSAADLKYSRSFATTTAIRRAAISVIKERLSQFGIDGYAMFLLKKIEWTWTDGTYYVPIKLARHPLKRSVLHKYVLSGSGKSNKLYLIFAQIVQAVILSMISAGCVSSLIKGTDKVFRLMTVMCLGLAFFLLFWETRSRYLVFMIPVFVVMAVNGMFMAFLGVDRILAHISILLRPRRLHP